MSLLNTVVKALVVGTVTATTAAVVYKVTKDVLDYDDEETEALPVKAISSVLDALRDD